MHVPYQSRLNHPCDFRVKYRFYTESEGGRKCLPTQGIRFDFCYEHEMKDHFIIWPEFEDSNGEIILEGTVLFEGFAKMWIINDDFRPYHSQRIKVGTKGYFMEGKRIGECEVVELIYLKVNK